MFWRSKQSRARDLDAEMETHLQMAINDRIARGESPEDAARNARRQFGNATTVREATSDTWSSDWPYQVAQEIKQAARSLARVPVFSLAAVLTLALGIGANTAIFSVINGVVLRPLPFAKPEQLVYITSPKMNLDHFPLDGAEFLELRERNRSFTDVGAAVVTRLMTTLLFGVKPVDATTFAAVAGLMLAVACVAAYLPARRATRVDPLTALRAE